MKHFQKLRAVLAVVLMAAMLVTGMPVALAASFSAYVTSGSMAVYEDESLSNKLGSLPKYTVVTVKSHSGGVAKISYDGKTVYAKTSAMEKVDSVAEEATVSETTKVYKEASTSSGSAKLSKGTKVNVIAVNGSWALIEKDGVGGYVKEKYLAYASAVETPKATEKPEPVSQAVVNADTKVYKKASTSSTSASVKKGTVVDVLSMDDGWAYIRNSAGTYAYIKSKYLSDPDELEATPAPTAQPTAEPTAQPTEKPTAEPTAAPKPTGAPEAVAEAVVNANTKVYKKASTSSGSAGVKKGTEVEVLEISGDWAYIRNVTNGVLAYIKTKYLTISEKPTAAPTAEPTAEPTAVPTPEPTATPKPTEAPADVVEAVVNANTKVYKKASTSSGSASVKKGTEVEVLEISGDWAYIRNVANGAYAYIKTKYLTISEKPAATPEPTPEPTAEPAVEAMINADTLVYSEPDSSAVSASVRKGTVVEVLKVDGDWAYIRSASGVCAYIKAKYLSAMDEVEPGPTPDVETIVNAVVNADTKVYKKASTSSASAKVKKGTKVEVLELSGDWAYIRNESGVCAYIKNKYLNSTESDVYDVYLLDEPIPAVVVSSKAGVYSQPGFWGAALGSIAQGTRVSITATIEDGSWVKVTGGDLTGWVDITHLGSVDAGDYDPLEGFTKETFGATVVTTDAQFYDAEGDGKGEPIAFGTDVTVGAYSDEWAYAEYGKKYGFIAVSDLSRKEYAELRQGDSGDAVAALEKALLAAGYFDAVPDKKFDGFTDLAVKRYQKDAGRSETGVADQTLQRMILSGRGYKSDILRTGLSKGDDGELVERLQTRLYALGYLGKAESVDGSYGIITAAAVSLFQNYNKLSTTSKADVNTIAKMYSADAVALPSGKKPSDETTEGGTIIDGSQSNNATFISDTLASTVSEYSSGMSNAKKLEYAIYLCQNQLGKPYVYGAEGPSSYDCTGLTYFAFRQLGITLKRTAVSQGEDDTYPKIENPSDLKRGDLVFFNTVEDKDLSDHAGLYLGGGWFIHASSGQGRVVVSTLASGYYSRVFSWGRRVLS